MSTHSRTSSQAHSPPSGNTTHASPAPATPGPTGGISAMSAGPVVQRRRRRSTNYLPSINPITMMEEDNVDVQQSLGVVSGVQEDSAAEDSKRRTLPADDPQVDGDITSKRPRRSGLRQAKAASIPTAPATVTRKRASAAKTSTASPLAAPTPIASTPPTPPIPTASTSTVSAATVPASTASMMTAGATPRTTTKRKKRERAVASHPYILEPLAAIVECAESSTASQGLGSPSTSSVPHSSNEDRSNSRGRRRGSVQRRVNRADHAVRPATPSSARNVGEVQSEEAAVHALMHMQHDSFQRERSESYSPVQDARQPYQQQHQHQYQQEHQYQHHQNQDLAHNHMLYSSPPLHASISQNHSPDHFTDSYRSSGGQQIPQDLYMQAHGYESHHHYANEPFNCSNFENVHEQDAYAVYQESPTPDPREYPSHYQHSSPGDPQQYLYHTQSLAPTEMHFQHGHYPTRPLNIPPQVIDCTLRLHQAFYDWGFVEGFATVRDQTIHGHDQHDHQRQAEYQRRWEMYERGLQVGIALAQEQQQQQQLQDDATHYGPTYATSSQRLPSHYSTPAPISPHLTRADANPVILPALPAGGPLPRMPLGHASLPAPNSQSDLPESLDRDWCVLPKIVTFPPVSPPSSSAAGTESHGERAGRDMLAAEASSTVTSTPSMFDLSSAAASSASTCSPPSAPDTPRRNDHFNNRQ
ncbi:hypothetical protein BGZ72_007857 [Mortierella alpina]|nr:hypothetical protein BGZ72_007857 [Mortierella alpina]